MEINNRRSIFLFFRESEFEVGGLDFGVHFALFLLGSFFSFFFFLSLSSFVVQAKLVFTVVTIINLSALGFG